MNSEIKPVVSFVLLLVLFIVSRQTITHLLIDQNITSYHIHMIWETFANVILITMSYFFIKKHNLFEQAGIHNKKAEKLGLFLFPVIYLLGLNILFLEPIPENQWLTSFPLLVIYCISIGYAEEYSIRGFLQTCLVKHFGTTKQNTIKMVLLASFIFGMVHLIRFNQGLYGELSQIFFAAFIGICFGFLLLATKRLYPLIIFHTVVDIMGKLEYMGIPVQHTKAEPTSLENSIVIVLLVLPILLYGLWVGHKKVDYKNS